jgi:hypothetical protein
MSLSVLAFFCCSIPNIVFEWSVYFMVFWPLLGLLVSLFAGAFAVFDASGGDVLPSRGRFPPNHPVFSITRRTELGGSSSTGACIDRRAQSGRSDIKPALVLSSVT